MVSKVTEKTVGPVQVGEDPFVNDPKMFYDILLRRRNWANASFCCGAGSIHRRDALREAQLIGYAEEVTFQIEQYLETTPVHNPYLQK